MNKVILIGHLGSKPEMTKVGDNNLAKVSIAMKESWKDQNQVRQERTTWVRLSAWGNLAELMFNYLDKGSKVAIEGKIVSNTVEKDGQKTTFTEVQVQNIEFLDKRPESQTTPTQTTPDYLANTTNLDDDIPF